MFSTILIVGCGSQKNEEIDISSLQLIPKKEKKITLPKEEKIIAPVINDLRPLLNKDQLSNTINLGKENPFRSLDKENNETLKNLNLTGFLSANNKKYALVNYFDKSGYLTSDSLGGINTNLLPDGAKVKKIDFKNNSLVLIVDNESYEIFLD